MKAAGYVALGIVCALVGVAIVVVPKGIASDVEETQNRLCAVVMAQTRLAMKSDNSPEVALKQTLQSLANGLEGPDYGEEMNRWGFSVSVERSRDATYLRFNFDRPKPRTWRLELLTKH